MPCLFAPHWACSAPPAADGAPLATPLVATVPPAAVGASSAALRAERLAADVGWLADDAREGRRAGTRGEREAAEWIAARLEQLGLEPAGERGFLQPFAVPLPAEDGGGSGVLLTDAGGSGAADGAVQVGAADGAVQDGAADGAVQDGAEDGAGAPAAGDVAPLFCSEGGEAQGALWFHGYGVEDGELGLHEHGEEAPAGRVALLVRGAPPAWDGGEAGPAPEERERLLARWRPLFTKIMTAKHRGAAAVLVAQHPGERGQELPPFDPGSAARAGIPALFVSVEAAEALVPGYAERVRAIDADPRSSTAEAVDARHVRVVADVRRGTGTAWNVLGLLRGGDAGTVIVGAHFDHLGHGGIGSLAPGSLGEVHNGADDNASGVAVALEMAREMALGAPPAGDVLFALWSGEELGLLGSQHFTEHPTVPLEGVLLNVNLDMVGRAGDGRLYVLGAGTSPAFAGWLAEAGPAAGLELEVNLSPQGIGGSDHQSFVRRQIPALHLFSGLHGDYHRPSDTAERFEAGGAARVARLSLDLVARAHAARALPFAEAAREPGEQRPMRGFRVRFGSQPDYGFGGPGVKLAGTSPGSPAERAGFLPGDVLIAIDDLQIDTLHDFMYALGIHKPGDVVRARFLRDGSEQSTLVTLVSAQPE